MYATRRQTIILGSAAILTLPLPHLALARKQKPDPSDPANYQFNRTFPPKLKTFQGRVFDVPPDNLRQTVGEPAQWDETKRYEKLPFGGGALEETKDGRWLIKINKFKLTRVRHWVSQGDFRHFSEDEQQTVTIKKGYSKTQQSSFSQALELNGGISFDKLSVSVKNTLQMSSSTTEAWQEEESKETKRTYHGGKTYITWILYDTLYLDKIHTEYGACCAGSESRSNSQLDVIEQVYEDSVSDDDLKIINSVKGATT